MLFFGAFFLTAVSETLRNTGKHWETLLQTGCKLENISKQFQKATVKKMQTTTKKHRKKRKKQSQTKQSQTKQSQTKQNEKNKKI